MRGHKSTVFLTASLACFAVIAIAVLRAQAQDNAARQHGSAETETPIVEFSIQVDKLKNADQAVKAGDVILADPKEELSGFHRALFLNSESKGTVSLVFYRGVLI
jgi:hypothetical protein